MSNSKMELSIVLSLDIGGVMLFFVTSNDHNPYLYSFPTRRSSDAIGFRNRVAEEVRASHKQAVRNGVGDRTNRERENQYAVLGDHAIEQAGNEHHDRGRSCGIQSSWNQSGANL